MEAAGWEVEFAPNDIRNNRTNFDKVPHDTVSFIKGDIHVWLTEKAWRIAKLVDGYYANHRSQPDLQTILQLDKESKL